jgi:Fur family ferric uptake transcriptional regulator
MTTLDAPGLREQLRAAGLKATPQRVEVLTILRDSDKHLDAESIHLTALGRGADISLATVYRTLGALTKAGLVEPRALAHDQGRDHYESADRPDHHHFTCQKCGQVYEFETQHITRLKEELKQEHGWDLTSANLYFEGICDKCARRGLER